MNLNLLIDRWEKEKGEMTVDDCISQLKMLISGEIREPYTLDSICHMNKHKGKSWKQVIEQDPAYVSWLYMKFTWFQLDEAAHNYYVEMEAQKESQYNDGEAFTGIYND